MEGVTALLLLLAAYFVPTIVAYARGHTSAGGILIVNLFLGWTGLGWIGALAWSASAFQAHAGTR